MDVWQPLIFFEDEDEEQLKEQFVALSALHGDRFTAIDICKYIFRDLHEPELRALQSAEYWSKDLDLQERVRQRNQFNEATEGRQKRINLLMSIAENERNAAKDRISAILGAATIEGEITKAIEKKVAHIGADGKPISKTRGFLFTIDEDADKPPPEEVDG